MRSKQEISSLMSNIKSQDTKPELLLKQALSVNDIKFEENVAHLPGKPDITLPEYKIAIFVDGDLWHGNQWRLRNKKSIEEQFSNAENKEYWVNKIQKNVIRDCRVTYDLLDSGWVVIRLWESEILDDVNGCIEKILDQIRSKLDNPMVSRLPEKTIAEFFAGIGLMRMGLEKHGWKVTYANDFDDDKVEMYSNHFQDERSHISNQDIHKLKADDIPSVTLATASFPCNDLSVAGARLGLNDGKQSSAFWGFVKIINDWGERKPPFVLLENVVGFLTSKSGEDFKQALLTLNGLGYFTDAFILDAASFVPQSRKRLFVIGIDQSVISTTSTHFFALNVSDTRPKPLVDFISNHPEISWNIRSLPKLPQLQTELLDIIEDIPHDSSTWWSPSRAEYLLNQMSEKHRKIAERMINGPTWSYGTVFRRVRKGKSMAELRTDGIAGCLRTPRGGSGRQILFKAGKGKYFARLLSPLECARLMGADEFKITVSLNQALFGFGDAVCVPVIEWIATQYLNPLINELIHEFPVFNVEQPRISKNAS